MQPNPRAETFGYTCRRCSLCCYHKAIQVNPYEVARLARKLDQSTTEFRNAWTREGAGTLLNQREDGACVFLGPEGCSVHSDRPLVCRVYPLGRHLREDGVEWFSHVEQHPQSAGERADIGTIGEYLEEQGAGPFLKAADEYFYWLCAASQQLEAEGPETRTKGSVEDINLASELIDMDTAIARHCARTGAIEPTDIEQRKELHLAILYQQLHQSDGGEDGKA